VDENKEMEERIGMAEKEMGEGIELRESVSMKGNEVVRLEIMNE